MPRVKGSGAARAYEEIKNRILSFKILAGQPISENEYVQELQVSRTLVREAMRSLEADGLLEKRGQRMVVASMNEKDIAEICELREALECKAVELIIENGGLSPERIDALREFNNNSYKDVTDHALNFMLDDQFHTLICTYSGNTRLIAFFNKLRLQITRARWLTIVRQKNDPTEEHARIIEALERNDIALAKEAVSQHMRTSKKNYLEIFNDDNVRLVYNCMKSFIPNE